MEPALHMGMPQQVPLILVVVVVERQAVDMLEPVPLVDQV
jgi:hypothetical protein